MVRVKTSLVLSVLLFNLIACSPSQGTSTDSSVSTPTFTPFVSGTETALAEGLATPTPWFAGTETALANLTPTPWVEGTQTAIAMANASPTPPPLPTFAFPTVSTVLPPALEAGTFSPVLYGNGEWFLVVGGFKMDQGWLSGGHAAHYMSNQTAYDFYSPRGFFQTPGSAPERSPICENYYLRSPAALPEPMVGVANGWIPQKRLTSELAVNDPSYTQMLWEWFQGQGNSPAEIQITRILQVDIEGDEVNEVLLSASYFKETTGQIAETGDYSVVLLRKVIGNTVLTIPLIKEYYVTSTPQQEMSYPYTYTLLDAVDLNRDGTLEVVVDVRRWEGGGALVFRVDGQNVREVLRAIC